MREVLQVIGEVRGAVELDKPSDERTNDDVDLDEPVHGRHSAGLTEAMRIALLARMLRNAKAGLYRMRTARSGSKSLKCPTGLGPMVPSGCLSEQAIQESP
jgi:hypothetical protein